jgi:glycosyltransferase involved in cell wall biosynthesis
MTALAEHLKQCGYPVVVVSAFEGLAASGDEDTRWQRLQGYHLERVVERRTPALDLLVRGKSLLRRLLRGRRSVASSTDGGADLAEGATPAARTAPLHRALFAVLHTIDDKKRWAIDARRSIVARAKQSAASVIIVSAPPMSVLFGAVSAARRVRLPVIIDLRDPLYLDGSSKGWAARWRERWAPQLLERYVMRRADAVVTTSPSLQELLCARYPAARDRIYCVQNGFDGSARSPRSDTGHRLVIVYAGALYLNRNPFPLLEALDDLLHQPGIDASRIEFILAGECERYGGVSLADWLAPRLCGRVVTIERRLDTDALQRLYERATLLVNFAEGQRTQVPAKTFEILALGREVLVLCEPDSDTARIVTGLAGVTTARSSGESLRATLHDLYQRHAVEGRLRAPTPEVVARFARSTQNERFRELIQHITGGTVTPPLDPQ